MLRYTNGWGHLIMSIVTMFIGLFIYIHGNVGLGSEMIGIIVAAWFIPNAAQQTAQQIAEEIKQNTSPPA